MYFVRMQEMISKQEQKPDPLLRAIYNFGPNNNMVFVETGSVNRKTTLDGTKAPRLYENLKLN